MRQARFCPAVTCLSFSCFIARKILLLKTAWTWRARQLGLAAERGVAPEAVAEAFHAFETGSSSVQPLTAAAVSNQSIQESMRLLLMVRAYQVWLGVWQECCFHPSQLEPA